MLNVQTTRVIPIYCTSNIPKVDRNTDMINVIKLLPANDLPKWVVDTKKDIMLIKNIAINTNIPK